MEYSNPNRRSIYQNLILTWQQKGYWLIIPVLFLLTLILTSYLPVWNKVFVKCAVTILGLISLRCLNIFVSTWLTINPNEKLIKINEDKLEILYPFPKATQRIDLNSITLISVNLLVNQAWVSFEHSKTVSINSLPAQAWREIAGKHPIPTLLYYKIISYIDVFELDECVLQPKQGKLYLTNWQAFLKTYPKVKFLGNQESFNYYNEGPAVVLQYALTTSEGVFNLDFTDGFLQLCLLKGLQVKEVDEIANALQMKIARHSLHSGRYDLQ